MNMNNELLKKIGVFAGIVAFFLVLAYGFMPELLQGKIVNQSDITGYSSISHESYDWNKAHPDDPAYWTGSSFSGMPVTAFTSSSKGDLTESINRLLLTGRRPASYLFLSLLGAFLLMLSLGIGNILAVGGAIAVTFCSYNPQIIQVGHNSKMLALAYLPWVLAAVIFTYKSATKGVDGGRKWLPVTLLGAVLFAVALSLQIKANHQQITYYLALMIGVYVIALFLQLVCSADGRSKLGRFFAASALLLAIGLLGIGTNAIKLAPLYEYTQHTMRGGSELSHPTGKEVNQDGLQLDYATAWSYGWEELPNMMIPNFNGGSSAGSINPDKSEVVALFKQSGQGNPKEIAKSLPFYWGPQPFTAGPMYMGAVTIFLFLLGLFLYKGSEKWWMLAATILAIFLALGSHFMFFTKLFYAYAPMYNKFRTVSMALVILQFTLPMLGFLVLDRVLKKEYSKKDFLNKGGIALAVSAGFCFLFFLIPGLAGSFSGASDAQMQEVVVDALKADRRHLLANDAFWSMLFILATFVLILWTYGGVPADAGKAGGNGRATDKSRRTEASFGICFLVLINLLPIGHRYLNKDHFTTQKQFSNQFKARKVDQLILEDKSPSYRVLDLTADIFNDTFNPYWHKSIGGYSPAKMQRYQDLIERHIVPELQTTVNSIRTARTIPEIEAGLPGTPVICALNTKYFIVDGDAAPAVNSKAYGNAWFVDSFVPAATPDEEIAMIGEVDLRKTAVIGEDFAEARKAFPDSVVKGPRDTIYMISYSPNELRYHYIASSDRAAVFSEIYYADGWSALLNPDVKTVEKTVELDIFRVDWILRGAVLPAGEYDIVMRFAPKVYSVSEKVSRASSISLLAILLLAVAGIFAGKRSFKTAS